MKVVDSIRQFNAARPFVPYEIHIASGEKFRVRHPNFVSVSPKDHFVVVMVANERVRHLNVIQIERAIPIGSSRNRRRAA